MALIPFDVALGGINTIAGIFGANEADRQRQRQLEQAARQRAKAIEQLAQASNDAYQDYQRRLQAGEFDATRALDLIGQQSGANLRNALGQSMTSLRNLGYKPGDTPLEQGAKSLTSNALLQEQAQRLQAQQSVEDRRQQALNYLRQVQGQESQARMGLGGQMVSEGMAMPGNNLENAIKNAIASGLPSKIGDAFKKSKKDNVTPQPQVSYAPGSMAAGLEQFKNIRLSGVPNRFGS